MTGNRSNKPRGWAAAALCLVLLAAQAGAATDRRAREPAPKMRELAPAVIDDTLVIGGDELAARKLASRLTVAVGVNGTGPYRFVVDSGADTSVIGARLANAMHLPAGRSVMLNGITESRRVDRVLVDALQVGPSQFQNLELPRLEERDLGAVGMIGLDALAGLRLMLDFEAHKVSVNDASEPAPRLDGEIVVVARLKHGQLILTQVKASGIGLDAVVDTGSEITIGNLALRNQLFHRNHRDAQKIEVIGVTGTKVSLDLLVVDELRIGGIVLGNIPIAFADVAPFDVFSLKERPALLLGTDLMENFRKVSLDFRARKVRFQLRKCNTEGITISTGNTPSRLTAERGHDAVCQR